MNTEINCGKIASEAESESDTEPSEIDYTDRTDDDETEPSEVEELDIMTISACGREGMSIQEILTCNTEVIRQRAEQPSILRGILSYPKSLSGWKNKK